MKSLRESIKGYLSLRRDLGFKLTQAALLLRDFTLFMETKKAPFITTALALEWALRPAYTHPSYWAKRLSAVRLLARHCRAADPRTEVPPDGLLPRRVKRAKPYWYTEEDINCLMKAAADLPSPGRLRGQTYACLLGLLAVTGLRIGEALSLKLFDVDLEQGLLTIRHAKFDKSRLVPLHGSTRRALRAYAHQRDVHLRPARPSHFFVSEKGMQLSSGAVHRTFRKLRCQTGLIASPDWDLPQLHHFRHRFAMVTLLRLYQANEDIERQLPVLSTFLGHVCISDTYWYLSAHPQLLGQAVQRLEHRWQESSS